MAMITLNFRTVDGIAKRRTYKTLRAAQKATWAWVGKDADIARGYAYAVSTDGVVTVACEGCTLAALFGRAPEKAPEEWLAKNVAHGVWDLQHKGFTFATLGRYKIGGQRWHVSVIGDDELAGWIAGEYTDDLHATLAEVKRRYTAYLDDMAALSKAEHDAENAWLRKAEQGTAEDWAEEDRERARENFYG